MACLTPITLKNPNYNGFNSRANKVPCGKCPECLKSKANQWTFRLLQEQEVSSTSYFVTLTYTDDNLCFNGSGIATLAKYDIQSFWKRLRIHIERNSGLQPKLKYYAVGEYGTKSMRPHYHAIVFNLPSLYAVVDEFNNSSLLGSIWKLGHVRVDECNVKTMKYVAKYVMKSTRREQRIEQQIEPEFAMMSKRLGANFLTPQMRAFLSNREEPYLTTEGGQKQSMPRYYRDQVFTDEQKARMRRRGEIHREMDSPFPNGFSEFEFIKDQFRKLKKVEFLKRNLL